MNETSARPRTALMKQLLLLPCIVWTLSLSAQWMRQYPVPKMEFVLDMDVSSDGYGYAVGGDDMVLKLDPVTMEWTTLTTQDLGWTLTAVDYLDGTMGNVVVAGGQGVLVSFNGGNTWTQVPGAPGEIQTLKAINMNTLIAISYNGVWRYANNQWTDLNLPVSDLVIGGCVIDADHIWCYTAGTDPVIYRTDNGGNDWHMNTQIARPDVVRFFDTMTGTAFDGRDVYRSADGGQTWNQVSHNVIHNSVPDFTYGGADTVIIAGTNNGDPSISRDGGATWDRLDMGFIINKNYSVAATSALDFWAGSDLSSIGHTTDGGVTWVEAHGPDRGLIYAMYFADRNNGFAGGTKGVLLRTTNGGSAWEDVSLADNLNVLSLHGTSVNDVWAATNQHVFHSTDGGSVWEDKLMLPGQNINDIYAAGANLVMGVTSGGLIIRSADNGTTWDTVYMKPGKQLRCITHVDGQKYFATGYAAILLKSMDAGMTWDTIVPPVAGLQYEEAQFIGNKGFLISSSFVDAMWTSDDGGETWHDIALPIQRFWDGVYFMSPDTGVVVCRSNQEGDAYVTVNGGQDWQSAYQKPFSFHGVTGVPNPNGIAWLHGYGSDIEVLPFCANFPAVSQFSGSTSPCEGDTVSYSVVGVNIDTYHWLFPSGWQILGNGNSDTVAVKIEPGLGVITVYGSNSCGSTNPITVQAGAGLLPEMVAIDGPVAPCEAELRTYSVTASEVHDFNWTFPGSDWTAFGNTNAEQVQVFVGETPGKIVVQGSNNCGTDEIDLDVVPAMRPRMHSVTGPATVCAGDTVVFVSDPEFADTIVWTYPPDWIPVGLTGEASIMLVAGSVSGVVSVHALNDCGMSAIQEINVTVVAVFPINIIHNGNMLSLSAGGVAYQWYLNGAPIAGATSAIYTATQSGLYHAVVTDQNGCTVITESVEITISATSDPDAASAIFVYPNPADDQISVTVPDGYQCVDMLSPDGRIISDCIMDDAGHIDVSTLSPGIYFIRFNSERGYRYGKVNVIHR